MFPISFLGGRRRPIPQTCTDKDLVRHATRAGLSGSRVAEGRRPQSGPRTAEDQRDWHPGFRPSKASRQNLVLLRTKQPKINSVKVSKLQLVELCPGLNIPDHKSQNTSSPRRPLVSAGSPAADNSSLDVLLTGAAGTLVLLLHQSDSRVTCQLYC